MLKYFLILTQLIFCLDFDYPDIEKYELDNGMTILLSPNYQQPMIFIRFNVSAGLIDGEKNKQGIARIIERMFQESQNYTEKEFNLAQSKAGTWHSRVYNDGTTFNTKLLKEDLDLAIGLYSEMFRYPIFNKKTFRSAKAEYIDWFKISLEQWPMWTLNMAHSDHLLSGIKREDVQGLKSISYNDIINFYESYYQPQNISLMIVGDFNIGYMKRLLNKYFGDWNNSPNIKHQKQYHQKKSEGITVRFIENPKLTKAHITITMPGVSPQNDDVYSLLLIKEIIGSGWNSRFYKNIETIDNRHDIFFYTHSSSNYSGTYMGFECKYLNLEKTYQSMLFEIENIRKNNITDQELYAAKSDRIGSIIMNFEDPIDYTHYILEDLHGGFTLDQIKQEQIKYATTSLDKVNKVANKYLDHENFYLIVSGNKDSTMTFLNQFENVEMIHYLDGFK